MSISIELYNKCALFFSIIQLLLFLSYHLHHHQFRRLSLSKFLSDGGVVVMFSIFPHFVLRNISLALAFDVLMFAKLLLTLFLLLCTFLVVFLFTVLVSLCSVIYVFPKKKKALPLSRERELSLPIPSHRLCECGWWWLWKLLLWEAKLSSFEKEMYLRLCDSLTAIMFFLSVFLWENATPTNLGILLPNYLTQSSSSWHSRGTVVHHTRLATGLPPAKGRIILHLRLWKCGPKRQMTERE